MQYNNCCQFFKVINVSSINGKQLETPCNDDIIKCDIRLLVQHIATMSLCCK